MSEHSKDCHYIRWNFWLRGLVRYDVKRCERCRKLKAFRRDKTRRRDDL